MNTLSKVRGTVRALRAWAIASALVLTSSTSLGAPSPSQSAPVTAERRPALAIGDRAPALPVLRWLSGPPVNAIEPGRVTMLVFWAPWSGASTQVLPRLAELARRNAGRELTVVALCSADARGTSCP